MPRTFISELPPSHGIRNQRSKRGKWAALIEACVRNQDQWTRIKVTPYSGWGSSWLSSVRKGKVYERYLDDLAFFKIAVRVRTDGKYDVYVSYQPKNALADLVTDADFNDAAVNELAHRARDAWYEAARQRRILEGGNDA